jgi:hypothetical protein
LSPARSSFAPRKPGAPSVGRRRSGAVRETLKTEVPEGLCSEDELAELLASLTGKEVKVGKGPVLTPGPAQPVVCAVFTDDDGAVGAVLMADVAAAAGIAAALTLMSAGSVTEAMRFGRMDEALLENWGEVANICTQVVRLPGFPRFQLKGSVQSSSGLGAGVDELLEKARYRAGWSVQVPQYANGRMSVLLHRED